MFQSEYAATASIFGTYKPRTVISFRPLKHVLEKSRPRIRQESTQSSDMYRNKISLQSFPNNICEQYLDLVTILACAAALWINTSTFCTACCCQRWRCSHPHSLLTDSVANPNTLWIPGKYKYWRPVTKGNRTGYRLTHFYVFRFANTKYQTI